MFMSALLEGRTASALRHQITSVMSRSAARLPRGIWPLSHRILINLFGRVGTICSSAKRNLYSTPRLFRGATLSKLVGAENAATGQGAAIREKSLESQEMMELAVSSTKVSF